MNLQKNSYPAHIVLKDTYLMVVKLLGGWLDLVLGGHVDEEDTQRPAIVSLLGGWLYSHKFAIQSSSLMFSCCVDTVGLLVDRTRVVAGFNHTPTYQLPITIICVQLLGAWLDVFHAGLPPGDKISKELCYNFACPYLIMH